MPGQPFLYTSDSYQGVAGEGVRSPVASEASGSHTLFLVWLVVIGVLIPALVLGGLRVGVFGQKLSFVFKNR